MADTESEARDSSFTNADGKKIFCHYWCDDIKDPRALIFICHGAGEHCLWYTPLAQLLKEAGCYVFAHDHVGHGQSEGDRMHVEDFHEYVRDCFHHFDQVAEQFPNVPKFAIGHSMGGAITIISAMERTDYFDGIILIAPAVIADPVTVTPLKVLRYKDDPLVYHGGLKARWGASFLKWLQFIEANMRVLKCPVMTMHGTEDRLTHPNGSRLLAEKVSSTDKTLKLYEGFYHQLHSEPGEDGAGVRQEVVDWITARLKK
ncbi:monoglyceride lipase-like isoform X2 [Littorina saxatilis]|uniref:monoglyceride lipase-like isoform X2 n=1 Tax=Littorina saxatilis TaxID=31220 RepID=UPI0038B589EB